MPRSPATGPRWSKALPAPAVLDGEDRESTTSGCQIHLMTPEEQQVLDRPRRLAGKRIIEEQARRQMRTFLDELKNGTTNYRTVASLGDEVAKEYRGRAVLELLQNAHDVLGRVGGDDRRQVSFVLNSSPEQPELLIANSGRPFRREDFSGICQLAQSPKDPNKSVGNKGLGFRSVLELTIRPEVWSTAPAGGDIAFTFGFDPDVLEPIARVAKRLFDRDAPTDPEFGPEPVVDWSDRQIEEYRGRLSRNGIKPVEEVNKYLSPYVLPRFLGDPPDQVARLLEDGHVTVIRLPLDGGKAGRLDEKAEKEAVKSVRDQLRALDEAAMVFLHHLSVLRITIDGECVELMRSVDPELPFPVPAARRERVRVGRAGPEATDATERSFHVWSRTVGGDDHPDETKRIENAVLRLPNRWPEVRTVEVAVAVEETRIMARPGLYVIFLPTETKTTVGAHINAPFYGSLDRRHIDFKDAYNKLLLEFVTKLMRDAVEELVAGDPERWRGRAVIDLLAPVPDPPEANPDEPEAKKGPPLTGTLREFRFANERPLDDQALILCDGAWSQPGVARTMPDIPAHDPFGEAEWRAQAGFAVASSALDERREAVEALLRALGGSPDPKEGEWADTLARMAGWVGDSQTEPAWNDFLRSAFDILPQALISEPADADTDPLRTASFLPTSDGQLRAASDDAQVFFRPRHGADDAAGFVDSIPNALKEQIAFLHSGVKTLDATQQRNTEVQKFLDGRFVRSFRREDLLRNVIRWLPKLPVAHGSAEATECAEILSWTLKLIGDEEQEGLSPMLSRLPVACHDGWFAMEEAVFGPGWDGRCGDQLKTLADGLPGQEGEELLRSALLPPGDDRWFPQRDKRGTTFSDPHGIELANRGDQFARAGVVDGLRLEACDPIRFWMSGKDPTLPDKAPSGIPQSAWDDWKEAVGGKVKPEWKSQLEYKLQDVTVLPILHREHLGDSARTALSNLILASLARWKNGWEEVTIRRGWWSQQIPSPLKHWLSTLPWLDDAHHRGQGLLREDPRPLHQRWFVPGSLLRGQSGRFRHLSPLSLPLAHRLGGDEDLLEALEKLGLNVYPTEDARTGPDLLEALAGVAKVGKPMPAGGFDVFLGQVRHAWRHFDRDRELPQDFVVRTKPRMFEVRTSSELKDVYLPDHSDNTRSLREHGQPIVAMRPQEAAGPVGNRLVKLGARRATGLEEHCRIDHRPSAQAVDGDGTQTLDAASLGWLPVVLLALHAHGGGNPAGPATDAWRQAAGRLRRARIRQCASIEVELMDAGRSVARSEPRAHWLSRDRILVLHRDIAQNGFYEEIAAASQAILDRQDLLKDLRLVLGALHGRRQPTESQIEAALERAEIDGVALANIRHLRDGETSTLVHRIRPVLKLLCVSDDGLDAAATDTAGLTEWLSKNARIPEWPTENLLMAAQESYDDFGMGYRTWRVLGYAAELPAWNQALWALGGKYEQITNAHAEAQAKRYLDEAAPLLRVFARHVATADASVPIEDQGELFSSINAVHESLEKDPEWPRLCAQWSQDWWKVPFGAVLAVLRKRYGETPAGPHLYVLEGVRTLDQFRPALRRQGVALEPDPLDAARANQYCLNRAVREVREVYEAWLTQKRAEPTSGAKAPEPRLDDSMYLREDWPEDDLFERATRAIADRDFRAAVKDRTTVEEMRKELGILPGGVEERGPPRNDQTREVAGVMVRLGRVSHDDLFARLKDLPEPPREGEGIGPPPPGPDPGPGNDGVRGSGEGSEVRQTRPQTSHLRTSVHLPELVGIVGEMHAFRFLQARFGIDESAWVSEFRTRVVPLLDGEKDVPSDSHGYDFRFTNGGTTWCVEVKSTTGDGTSFDLPSSELDAAGRIAPRKHERWCILRVRQALSQQPVCDWLPNPFEPGAGERLRLRQGGVTVEYTLSKHSEDDRSAASTSQCEPEDQ